MENPGDPKEWSSFILKVEFSNLFAKSFTNWGNMKIDSYLLRIKKKMSLFFPMFFMVALYSCKAYVNSSEEFAATPSGLGSEVTKPYVEINSSVAVLGVWDYGLVNGSNRCIEMVDKALGPDFANSMINFLPTHGFMVDPSDVGTETIAEASRLEYPGTNPLTWGDRICYRVSERECNAPTKAMIKTFEDGMAACFERAFSKGVGISITPHVDDGQRLGRWRNSHVLKLVGDSDWSCQNHPDSYYCGMLVPLANAIKRTRKSKFPVYFSAQGEMGATVFANPAECSLALELIRTILDPSGEDLKIKMGISLNFNKIYGNFPTRYVSTIEFKRLLRNLDFLGTSAYASFTLEKDGTLPYIQFDQVFNSVNHELARIETNLKTAGSHLELIFSEVGIGGSSDGVNPATSALEALSAPWAGVHGTFNPTKNPWAHPDVVEGARRFYCALGLYLSSKTLPARAWKVHRAFIWNLASWDIQGLYPTSSVPKLGSYLIPEMALALKTYNENGIFDCDKSEKIKQLPTKSKSPPSPPLPDLPLKAL
jgi:hypothetical protein